MFSIARSQCNECNWAALIELHGCAGLACVRTCTLGVHYSHGEDERCSVDLSRDYTPFEGFEISDYIPGHVAITSRELEIAASDSIYFCTQKCYRELSSTDIFLKINYLHRHD